jgi:hypothetical protein
MDVAFSNTNVHTLPITSEDARFTVVATPFTVGRSGSMRKMVRPAAAPESPSPLAAYSCWSNGEMVMARPSKYPG